MLIYELAALGAATCWALTGMIAAGPAGHLGALAFNRIRQVFVTVLLAILMLATGIWQQLNCGEHRPAGNLRADRHFYRRYIAVRDTEQGRSAPRRRAFRAQRADFRRARLCSAWRATIEPGHPRHRVDRLRGGYGDHLRQAPRPASCMGGGQRAALGRHCTWTGSGNRTGGRVDHRKTCHGIGIRSVPGVDGTGGRRGLLPERADRLAHSGREAEGACDTQGGGFDGPDGRRWRSESE